MTALSRALGVLAAAVVLAGVVWASHAPMTVHPSPDGRLRLAWSARPERLERCRHPSEAEQATLPPHMRRESICEGTTASYRLEVRQGGRLVIDEVLRGGGLRRDRRLYVFRELPMPPGDADISVRFERVEAAESAAGPRGADAALRQREAVPPRLALDRRLRVAPRQVVLVTYDPDRRALVTVQR